MLDPLSGLHLAGEGRPNIEGNPFIQGRPPGWPRRVAIIHYWLVTMRGGERVVEQLLRLFPHADVFTHVYDEAAVSEIIRERRVTETFIGRLPGARKHYQKYLPLMPMALEELDLSGYDLVISSESGPAKGVIVAPDALHLCYVHSPMRYLWDHYHQYKAPAGLIARFMMPWLFHRLREWDVSSARRIDRLVANSHFIQSRIVKSWGRDSSVVHPPIEVDLFTPVAPAQVSDRFLWVGQMTPYKRGDIALDAFNRLGLPLLMVGTGEMAAELRHRAGPTIEIRERLNFDELRHAYATCRALIFTAEEDFGIVPVEAMASGRPVIAYGSGGVLDSIVPGETGLFFPEQSADSLAETVRAFGAWHPTFDPAAAVRRARIFSPANFDAGILAALAL
jgi:glycosyltransferase involved in cell wall biosynthesis